MSLRIQALIAAGCLLLAFSGGYGLRGLQATAEIADLKAQHAGERTALATAQTAAVEQARADERRITHGIQEKLDAEHRLRLTREASERRAAAAVGGLRDDLATARAALDALAVADSTASSECRAAAKTASVCTGLLRTCEDESLIVARFAEDSHAAARTCVGAYRSLMPEAP